MGRGIATSIAVLALAGPAMAEEPESVVTLYGLVAPIVESVGATGATEARPAEGTDLLPASAYGIPAPSRRARMGSNISHLGIRGRERLSGDLGIVFQLETGFLVDDLRAIAFPDRNSAVGFDGPWGKLFAGQWDTPFKASTIAYGPMRIGITQDFPTLMSNPGFGVPVLTTQSTRIGGKADAAFDRRQGNSVQYWTPVVAGLQARFLYSVDEGRGSVVPGGPVVDPKVFGASLAWGPLGRQVGVSWERHDDYFGLTQVAGSAAGTPSNPSSRDEAIKLFGEVKVGPVRIAAFADRLEYRNHDTTPGAIDRYERAAVNVLVQPVFGAHRPWIAWTRTNAGSCSRVGGGACSTRGLGATQWVVGWLMAFSKTTEVYLVAQWLDNEPSATYATLPPIAGAVPGARYTAAGFGITHFF